MSAYLAGRLHLKMPGEVTVTFLAFRFGLAALKEKVTVTGLVLQQGDSHFS
jgi:hypothetical protein